MRKVIFYFYRGMLDGSRPISACGGSCLFVWKNKKGEIHYLGYSKDKQAIHIQKSRPTFLSFVQLTIDPLKDFHFSRQIVF